MTEEYGPRSRANARMLIDAAASLGHPSSVVKTTTTGYRVPRDVLEIALGVEKIQPDVEYPEPISTEEAPAIEEPPRAGPGSSRQAWVDYAAALGVAVEEHENRYDIIAKIDAQKEGN